MYLKIRSWVCCGRQSHVAKMPFKLESMCGGKLVVAMALSMLRASHNSNVVVHVACWILESTLMASIVGWF